MTDAYRSFFNNFGSGYRTKQIRLRWANPALPIYSIDIAPQEDACLREIFRSQGLGGNVKLIVGDSQRERSRWCGV
jgi:hypothetical protein